MIRVPDMPSSFRRKKARFRTKRKGNTLLIFLFALIIMVPMALGVLEYGLATLTRRQMQSAVNSAALEGLRKRDDGSDWRTAAKNRIELIFDEDSDPSTFDERVGAGPTIEFGSNQRIINSTKIGVYKPDIQLNEVDNKIHGDLVAGNYDFSDTQHQESALYVRTDFAERTVFGPTSNLHDSVLVRMRRTIDSLGLGPSLDNESGVSSSGSSIPHLWRRGPLVTDETIASKVAPGIRVRATAIAHSRPALRAGVRNSSLGLIGLVNLSMHIERWQDESAILDGSTTQASIFDPNAIRVTVVGESPYWTHDAMIPLSGTDGYIALTDNELMDVDGIFTNRVVGFGYATDIQVIGSTLNFTRNTVVANENASATFGQVPNDWNDLDVPFLMDRIDEFWREDQDNPDDPPNQLLLVPALVRNAGRI